MSQSTSFMFSHYTSPSTLTLLCTFKKYQILQGNGWKDSVRRISRCWNIIGNSGQGNCRRVQRFCVQRNWNQIHSLGLVTIFRFLPSPSSWPIKGRVHSFRLLWHSAPWGVADWLDRRRRLEGHCVAFQNQCPRRRTCFQSAHRGPRQEPVGRRGH